MPCRSVPGEVSGPGGVWSLGGLVLGGSGPGGSGPRGGLVPGGVVGKGGLRGGR